MNSRPVGTGAEEQRRCLECTVLMSQRYTAYHTSTKRETNAPKSFEFHERNASHVQKQIRECASHKWENSRRAKS